MWGYELTVQTNLPTKHGIGVVTLSRGINAGACPKNDEPNLRHCSKYGSSADGINSHQENMKMLPCNTFYA
jgi:hypothetical protein